MKISENNHKALRYLKTKDISILKLQWDEVTSEMHSKFKDIDFSNNINAISETFNSALLQSYMKMINDDVFYQQYYRKGVLLNFNIIGFKHNYTLYYNLEDCKNKHYDAQIYLFDGDVLIYCGIFKIGEDGMFLCMPSYLPILKGIMEHSGIFFEGDKLVIEGGKFILTSLIAYLNFIDFAEIETKHLLPNSKEGKTIKCKYINQTDFNIKYITSTWFTNLVKSDAFKVSGHFRLQPCHDENGLPTKKLIWINDFVKSGYTAPARKLKESTV